MRILDKYILRELLEPFLFCVATFSSLFIASSVLFRAAQYVSQYGTPFSVVGKMVLYSLPEVINYTFPMSALLASLIAFGRFSSNSEIVAMKSGGISFLRMCAPVLAAAFCLSIFSVVWAEKVVPSARSAYRDLIYYNVQKNTRPRSQDHIVLKSVRGQELERLIYARSFDESEGVMRGLTIEEFDDKGNLIGFQNAETAVWTGDRWVLHNGVAHQVSKEKGVQRSMKFDVQELPVAISPRDVSLAQKKPDQMTIKELKMQIEILSRQYLPTGIYTVEMYQRFAIPMASLFFAMVGAPLGVQPQRTTSSLGLGLSVVIIFLYYTIMTISGALGQGDAMPPMLAAWMPNLVCLAAGAYLIKLRSA